MPRWRRLVRVAGRGRGRLAVRVRVRARVRVDVRVGVKVKIGGGGRREGGANAQIETYWMYTPPSSIESTCRVRARGFSAW